VEVLREDGNPCAPGEVGKVVLTDLHSFALPLIRYDVGDFAEVAPASPCGRGLPAIRRVLGRVRNMLVHADGRKVWPLFPDRRFSEIAPVRQYQIVQKSLDHIEARMVLEQPLTTAQGAALRDAIGTALGREFRIDVIEVEGIPRTAAGKFEDFRSEVAD
jgi:phenylacetate-CoA ligase